MQLQSSGLEKWVTDHIEGKRAGRFSNALLHICSQLFKAGVTLKNAVYDRDFVKMATSNVPIVSIGNIVAGGTGKTPFAMLLIQELLPKKIAYLSRGYRGKITQEKMLSDGENLFLDAEEGGDEPYLVAKNYPVGVFVGKKREKLMLMAEEWGAELILLDDGMQYRSLKRDLEIVMMRSDDLFGKERFLPLGYLRDDPKRLKNADYVIFNHVKDEQYFLELKGRLKPFTSAPCIGTHLLLEDLNLPAGEKVAIFCGIANPNSFEDAIHQQGYDIVEKLYAPDHRLPLQVEWKNWVEKARIKGAKALLCTEKDWVKLEKNLECPLPIICTRAEMHITHNRDAFQALVQNLKSMAVK